MFMSHNLYAYLTFTTVSSCDGSLSWLGGSGVGVLRETIDSVSVGAGDSRGSFGSDGSGGSGAGGGGLSASFLRLLKTGLVV